MPDLDDSGAYLGAVGDIGVTEVRMKEEEEITEFTAFDNIKRL